MDFIETIWVFDPLQLYPTGNIIYNNRFNDRFSHLKNGEAEKKTLMDPKTFIRKSASKKKKNHPGDFFILDKL